MKTCNQCDNNMDYSVTTKDLTIAYICAKPECPNYGLLQIPIENMPDES